MSGSSDGSNFLKVKSFDKGDELVFGILDCIVHETVGEKDWIVSKLDLTDCFSNANFEFLFSFNSVSNTAAQLLKTGWVDKQEVTFDSLTVDLDSAFNVNLDDRDFSAWLDAL
mgnify:CR=1 FL=1